MRKVALVLFVIFALVQTAPAVVAFFNSHQTLIFNIDEEKHNGKVSHDDVKANKEFLPFYGPDRPVRLTASASFSLEESILPSPWLEEPGVPPNFC